MLFTLTFTNNNDELLNILIDNKFIVHQNGVNQKLYLDTVNKKIIWKTHFVKTEIILLYLGLRYV